MQVLSTKKTESNAAKRVEHGFGPFFDSESQILILGSFPSVKSREQGFYYMHPRNRFYRVLAKVYKENEPLTIEQRKEFLRRHKIALYDVIESCEIKGSMDSDIKNPKPADLSHIFKVAKIKYIYVTGKKAQELYRKIFGDDFIGLSSPSAANAAMSLDKLVEEYEGKLLR